MGGAQPIVLFTLLSPRPPFPRSKSEGKTKKAKSKVDPFALLGKKKEGASTEPFGTRCGRLTPPLLCTACREAARSVAC